MLLQPLKDPFEEVSGQNAVSGAGRSHTATIVTSRAIPAVTVSPGVSGVGLDAETGPWGSAGAFED